MYKYYGECGYSLIPIIVINIVKKEGLLMSVTIKSEHEIELMREAGRILAIVHDEMGKIIRPGISTMDINRKGEEVIRSFDCIPSFLNYNGYPASICVSVNDEVVHGIPNKKRILQEGDIVSLDAGVLYKGYHSDSARTHAVGEIDTEDQKLIDVTKQCFFEGVKMAKAGNHLFDISKTIQNYAESFGFSVVREMVGHGIGSKLHEEPQVPNFKPIGRGMKLRPGMTLAIEPMINRGKKDIWILEDDWTCVTRDSQNSAHYENTVLITEGEPELLSYNKDLI